MPDLLATKLYLPRPRRSLVSRPRLVQRLEEAADLPLILVSAPAGFGKTTLLSAWIHAQESLEQGRKAAWLSLDPGDNDPTRFATYLIAAFASLDPAIQPDLLYAALRNSQNFPLENALIPLINQLNLLQTPVLLVLDDLHVITNAVIYRALTFLVENLPPAVQLVISTRRDPSLPLARWRASALLAEIREPELRFTREEICAYLQQGTGLPLSDEDASELEARTEGWIAGIQMAVIAMRSAPGRREQAQSLPGFSGSHRYVLDYLSDEVLRSQPVPVQRFLLFTSILERISAPLCQAVLDEDEFAVWMPLESTSPSPIEGSRYQEILHHLEQDNLFLVPVDDHREWYRYHHLFAETLRDHLNHAYPQLVPELHRRASDWFFEHGYLVEAVEHALAAQDWERAARYIHPAADYLIRVGEVSTLLGWFSRLPANVIRASAELCTWLAWCHKIRGSYALIEPLLQDAQRALEQSGPPQAVSQKVAARRRRSLLGQAAIMRASIALNQEQHDLALDLSRQALEMLPEDHRYLRMLAVTNIAIVHLYRGDAGAAEKILVEKQTSLPPDGHPNIYLGLLSILVRVRLHRGALHAAMEVCRQALELATAHNMQTYSSGPYLHMADIYYEWNQLDEAAACCQKAARIARTAGQWTVLFYTLLCLSQVHQARGNSREAHEQLDNAGELLDRLEGSGHREQLALVRGRLLLAQGKTEEADQITASADVNRNPRRAFFARVTRVRLLLAQGRIQEAHQQVEAVLQDARSCGPLRYQIETQALKALALQASGQCPQALRALECALLLAEEAGYTRLFLDLGEPLHRLLDALLRTAARSPTAAAAARLVKGFTPITRSSQAHSQRRSGSPRLSSAPADTLSDREVTVLNLIAAGLSNEAIARELYISLNTVRTHTKSIYRKLNVRSRTQAVARAQAAGLM